MQQLFSSISFCLSNIGYLFILCLPVMTLEIALASLIASLDIQSGSDTAALEAIGEISAQVFFLVLASLILSVALSGGSVMDSLGESWNTTDEVATKIFTLTGIFMSIQLGFGFIGGMMGTDGALWFLIAATTVKYATLMPLFYLFYSLYESVKNKPQLEN